MKQSVFSRIEPRTVQRKVVDSIRDAIIRGDLAPGEHLTEVDLAAQMGVSRAPIREALRQLEQEGLVTSIPNRGSFVIEFTEQDVAEILTLRAALECMAIEWAIPHLTPADIAALRQAIEAERQAIAAQRLAELAELDMRFHEYICVKANHSRMLRTWYSLSAQCKVLLNRRFRILSNYTPGTVIRDHTAIVDALERQDAATAIALTNQIRERVQAELVQILHQPILHTPDIQAKE